MAIPDSETAHAPPERRAVRPRNAPLRWIFHVTGVWKRHVFGLFLIQIALSALSVSVAWLFKNMINDAVNRNIHSFTLSAVQLSCVLLLSLSLRAALRFLKEAASSGVENQLKRRLFSTLLTKSYAPVAAVHSGEWGNRLSSDTVVTAKGITDILPGAAGMGVRMIGALTLLIYMLPELTVILIPGSVLLLSFTWLFRRKLKSFHKRQQEADGRVRIHFSEYLTNLLIVRSFSREEQALREADGKMTEHRCARMQRNWFSNLCNTCFGAAMEGTYVLGGVYCAYGILTGRLSYGTLVGVIQLIGQVQTPFATLTGYIPQYYAMLASAERLMEGETWADDCVGGFLSDPVIRRFYQEKFAALALCHVSFSYPDPADPEVSDRTPDERVDKNERKEALHDLCVSFRKGEFIAFTGPSGCGKSTVLKLLMSVYTPDVGAGWILTDNDRTPLDARWRRLFAYVPQGSQLMAGTIREAVTFGDPGGMGREEDIWRALTVACAETFVREQAAGLDTRLGERGKGLSEGQTQRLAIARAVFSGRPILLLDEATSALDEATEAALLRNLRRMTNDTVLIVTHRPAALKICDREICLNRAGRAGDC